MVKGKIEQKRKELGEYQRVLDTRILTRLDLRALQTSEDLRSVQDRLTDLQLSIGQSRTAVTQSVDKLGQSVVSRDFMDSLYYEGIFLRQEQILDAHRTTFEWVFAGPPEDSTKDHRKWSNFS